MKNTLILMLLSIMAASAIAQNCNVKYDGIYATNTAVDEHGNLRYLRFYKDGTVISVYSEEKVNEVAKWFARELDDLSTGQYKIKNCKISFTTKSKAGKFNYRGSVTGNKLALYKDLPGKRSQKLVYEFANVQLKK